MPLVVRVDKYLKHSSKGLKNENQTAPRLPKTATHMIWSSFLKTDSCWIE